MNLPHTTPKRVPADPTLVIALTLACILFAVLLALSLFTILLALIAYIRRAWISEAERFVVEGWGWGVVGAVVRAAGVRAKAAKVGAVGWHERVWCGAEPYAKFKNKEL